MVARCGGPIAPKQPLDPLIDDQTLDSERTRQCNCLLQTIDRPDGAQQSDDVPDDAEVTHGAGDVEHTTCATVIAHAFTPLIDCVVESDQRFPHDSDGFMKERTSCVAPSLR